MDLCSDVTRMMKSKHVQIFMFRPSTEKHARNVVKLGWKKHSNDAKVDLFNFSDVGMDLVLK